MVVLNCCFYHIFESLYACVNNRYFLSWNIFNDTIRTFGLDIGNVHLVFSVLTFIPTFDIYFDFSDTIFLQLICFWRWINCCYYKSNQVTSVNIDTLHTTNDRMEKIQKKSSDQQRQNIYIYTNTICNCVWHTPTLQHATYFVILVGEEVYWWF